VIATRRLRSLGAMIALISGATLAALVATASPAAAAGVITTSSGAGSVLVSTDGITWSRDLPDGLFDGALLVPGVRQNRTLYVRNDSAIPAVLEIDAANATSGEAGFLDQLRLSVSPVGGETTAVALASAATCAPVVSELTLPPNGTLPVALGLELVDAEGAHHGSTATVQLHVLLRETGAAPLTSCPASGTSWPGPGTLAKTGFTEEGAAAFAAGTAGLGVVGGIAMLVLAQRRTRSPRGDAR